VRECSAVQAACTCPRCARCAWCRASATSTRMPTQEDEFADVPVCGCATLPSLGGGDCDAETAVFVRTHCAQVGVPRGVCGSRTPCTPSITPVCVTCVSRLCTISNRCPALPLPLCPCACLLSDASWAGVACMCAADVWSPGRPVEPRGGGGRGCLPPPAGPSGFTPTRVWSLWCTGRGRHRRRALACVCVWLQPPVQYRRVLSVSMCVCVAVCHSRTCRRVPFCLADLDLPISLSPCIRVSVCWGWPPLICP
jgi:hypothetical protein